MRVPWFTQCAVISSFCFFTMLSIVWKPVLTNVDKDCDSACSGKDSPFFKIAANLATSCLDLSYFVIFQVVSFYHLGAISESPPHHPAGGQDGPRG